MNAPSQLSVTCVSYLASVHTINVVNHPIINYGATITGHDRYLAGDGPLTAAVLRAFGHTANLAANHVADDPAGRQIQQRLHGWSVPLLPGPATPATTRTNTVICDTAGNRTGLFDLAGIDHDLTGLDIAGVVTADVVYLDCYEVLGPTPAPVLRAALQARRRTVLNLGGSPVPDWLPATLAGQRVDLLQTNGPESDPSAAAALAAGLAAAGMADLVVVTAGRHGAWARSADNSTWHAPSPSIQACQPQGAGAAFSAGMIHTLTSGSTTADRLRFACTLGSLWCSRTTDQPPPTLPEVNQALNYPGGVHPVVVPASS